jgi:hypothetical protein
MTDAPTFKRHDHFGGQTHSYSEDGRKVPGVTTILNAGIPKSGLIGWAGSAVAEYVVDRLTLHVDAHGETRVVADDLIRDIRATAKYPVPPGLPRVKLAKELSFAPNRDRDAGALKGQQVHDIARHLAQTGEWTPGPTEEHLEGYADALVDWWHQWDPAGLVLVERPVLNRGAFYAGTFDLIADLRGWGRCLVDYKAGRSGIYGETALQLAAYRYCDIYVDEAGDEQTMPIVNHCLGAWIRPDGSHETYELTAGHEEYRLFRYCYEVAKFLAGPDLFKLDGDPPVRLVKSEPVSPRAEAPT